MQYEIDDQFLLDCFKTLVHVPSPVSYYDEINPVMEEYGKEFGVKTVTDRKHTIYYELDGEDPGRTVLVGAHLDTLGLMVRHIDEDGHLWVRQLGGLNFSSAEGESVTVHTRDGRKYTGLFVCKSHSAHVFDDCKTLERNENTMYVILDEPASTAGKVRELGIENGDIVSIEPHFEYTKNGYIKSRFIDNKACVAAVLGALKYLKDHGQRPKYRTLLAFPHYEEINHGGAYVPQEVEEFLAIDIALIGPENTGSEQKVSVCCKDAFSPYDRGMTTRLIGQAKKAQCDHAVDVYYRYGTDAGAAVRAGANIYTAAIGMGCYCSHGRERTHIKGVENTARLILAYLLDI